MGSTFDKSQERSLQVLLKDLKLLQQDGSKNGDLKFTLADGAVAKAHSFIVKARCKNLNFRINENSTPSFHHVSPTVFNACLTYIYTSKLKLDAPSPHFLYSLYLLALDMGLEDLSSICEELMMVQMDLDSALQILQEAIASGDLTSTTTTPTIISVAQNVSVKSAIKKFSPPPPPDCNKSHHLQKLIAACIAHISETGSSLLKTNQSFLSLPTNVLKVVLDSEHLCMEEEEVWRCVLRWAQHKAGVVPSLPSTWKEEEREKVSHYLSPVISHVKLLLIDSRVFAEEVEPTGCVPMPLSLERYRYAALSTVPNNGVGEGRNRVVPRNAQKVFHASNIINNERTGLGKKLQEWHLALNPQYTNPSWKCIYRASQHGFGAEDFHAKVDDAKYPVTFIIVLLKNTKWICGGYIGDVPWSSAKLPKYMHSNKSFLFAMNPTTLGEVVQWNISKKHFAVCHDANSGPIFGAGADLYISSNCGSNLDSYSNVPHSYEINSKRDCGKKDFLFSPSYQFTVADYEVFVPNM